MKLRVICESAVLEKAEVGGCAARGERTLHWEGEQWGGRRGGGSRGGRMCVAVGKEMSLSFFRETMKEWR